MQFNFAVHYIDDTNAWGTNFKLIRAHNEKTAMEKFKRKFPDLTPLFATKDLLVGDSYEQELP